MRSVRLTRALVAVVVLGLVGGLALMLLPGHREKHLTAEFPRAVSLYAGSDVRILGVKVGTVDSVTPQGTKVVVRMSYAAKYDVPADAKAVLISPSVVGDRFIQLTPVYRGGRVLADGQRLGVDRTATPLELDQIYGSLNDLTKALGPDGANRSGALTRLLDSTSRNFGGQGAQFNDTVRNLGKLTRTLADNKDELFGSARQIETFVHTLAANDTTVRRFNDSLSSAADLLADERLDLAAAMRNLATALEDVRGFVQENKASLSRNIKGLNQVAQLLVKRRDALDEILRVAPDALNNLNLAYNTRIGTLDTRANVGETANQLRSDPAAVLCAFLSQTKGSGRSCAQVAQALRLGRAGALAPTRRVTEAQHVDRSLAGLVEVGR